MKTLFSTIIGYCLLFATTLCLAAPKDFCEEYSLVAVKQYWLMETMPSYECHGNHIVYPHWSPDPRYHYNWCAHDAVSQFKAELEWEKRDRYLLNECYYLTE